MPLCTVENAEERFWARVDKDAPNGCWEWTGHKQRLGYGQLNFKGALGMMAHRVSFLLVNGDLPDLGLDHLCRNRACVNPDHLEPVTHRENCLRGESPLAKNARKTHCDSGHEFSPSNTYIRPSGHRDCRTCGINRRREWRRRVRAAGGKPS